jgi:hypothetical protein
LCEKPKRNAVGHTNHLDTARNRPVAPTRGAGFPTCCIADFQVGKGLGIPWFAGLETRDTADLEVCATVTVSDAPSSHLMHRTFWRPDDFRFIN